MVLEGSDLSFTIMILNAIPVQTELIFCSHSCNQSKSPKDGIDWLLSGWACALPIVRPPDVTLVLKSYPWTGNGVILCSPSIGDGRRSTRTAFSATPFVTGFKLFIACPTNPEPFIASANV